MARWQDLPIIGGAYSDDTKPWSAQDCLNYIPVPAERGGTRSGGKLVGVPGMLTITASMQQAPVRGLHDVEGVLLAVTGNKLYRIGLDGTAAEIGTVPGVGLVSMAHNQVQYGHEVMIANGQSGYVYNTYTGDFGQVSDDGFPGFTVVDFIDGYIAGVEPQGRFWAHSELRDAKNYNTMDRQDAESAPDRMVSLIVSHREVMVLNQRSTSFFRNTGGATGTFQNSSGTEMEVGGASPFAVARLDNTVYWLGNDGIVYRLAGHSPQRVSTGPIEQAIARCDTSKAFAFTFEDRGHKVFYLTFPDGNTWGFDVWSGEWHRRASEGLNRWRVNCLAKWRGKWIAGDFSNGRLYQLDWAVQHEANQVLERRRTLGVIHDNENRLTVNAVKLVVDTGSERSVPDILPLRISGDLPSGAVGFSGVYRYAASGGSGRHTFSIHSGALPAGAQMGADGVVTYTYSAAGSFSWVVRVTDERGETADLLDTAAVILVPPYPIPLDSSGVALGTHVASTSIPIMETVDAGDLLTLQLTHLNNVTAPTSLVTPDGWTEVAVISQLTGGKRYLTGGWYTRRADGSEGGGSIAVRASHAGGWSGQVRRFKAGSFDPAAPIEVATVYGSGAHLTAPTLAPSWGAGRVLCVAACGLEDSAAFMQPTVFPLPDNQAIEADNSIGTTQTIIASCTAEMSGASFSPGVFERGGSNPALIYTVAIKALTP